MLRYSIAFIATPSVSPTLQLQFRLSRLDGTSQGRSGTRECGSVSARNYNGAIPTTVEFLPERFYVAFFSMVHRWDLELHESDQKRLNTRFCRFPQIYKMCS